MILGVFIKVVKKETVEYGGVLFLHLFRIACQSFNLHSMPFTLRCYDKVTNCHKQNVTFASENAKSLPAE